DRVVAAVAEVLRRQTVEGPTRTADATPRSRPACTGKYEWALALRCDGEWGESIDPSPSDCGTPAPPGPDSYSRALHRPPRTAPLLSRCASELFPWLPIGPPACACALPPARGCNTPSTALRDIPAIASPPDSSRPTKKVEATLPPANRGWPQWSER